MARTKLAVISVSEPKSVGDKGAQKVDFNCKDGDKTLTYFTFSKRLFPLIKVGGTIDADVEVEEKGNFINRKITEIYIDGKPQSPDKSSFTSRQESPEQRISIERQVSAKIAFATYGDAPENEVLIVAEQIYQWIHAGILPAKPKPATPPPAKAIKPEPPPAAPGAQTSIGEEKTGAVVSEGGKLPPPEWAELDKRIRKISAKPGWGAGDIFKKLGDLGGAGNTQLARYNILSDEGKAKFAEMVSEAEKV